jgi:hypothetical protein
MHGLPQAHMIGKRPAELWSPLLHRLVADRETASGEDLVDMAEAERKANVGPHGVTDVSAGINRRRSGSGRRWSSPPPIGHPAL